MSFRGRLILFFVLIVAVPMIAIAILVSDVAGDSATGKVDAALNEDLAVAVALHNDAVVEARKIGTRTAEDEELKRVIAAGDTKAAFRRLGELAGRHGLATYELTGLSGDAGGLGAGAASPFAAATISFGSGGGGPALTVSTTTVSDYATEVERITGADTFVAVGEERGGTLSQEGEDLPASGDPSDFEIGGEQLRVASAALTETGEARVAVSAEDDSGGFLASRPGVVIAVAVFILLALLAAGLITRTLQGQVSAMLAGARRIGEGDFTGEVPVVGDDELAGLAREFNEMRDRLSEQVSQLQRQRSEIESSVDRIGQAFASGLDRAQLLKILVETAVGASNAEYGLIALAGRAGDEVEEGAATEVLREVALAAEHDALRKHGAIAADRDGSYALASSLGTARGGEEPVGAMTIARSGRPFSASEQSVFLYLVGQAAASVENLALHELVSEQAVTDDLTGLPNNRAFRDLIEKEAARAERFRHDLSLLILDIDDFKRVNDTFGHLQGDAVLRRIGEILGTESRGIDVAARYGGEEFVVALPETDLDGALEVGERIRKAVASARIPRVDGPGRITVTASLGAATMPASGRSARDLIAAADGSLYEAKRAGKDRVVAAQGNGSGWRTDAE